MKKLLKVTVVILALTMLVQTMPMSRAVEQPLNIPELTAEQAALAATSYADVEENRLDGPVAHLAEDESLRTENAMHMKNENRSNTVLMYPFHRDVHGYYHMAAGSYTLAQDAAYLDFSFVYYNQLNEAYFADAFVYVGNFSSDYDYNGSGLLTKVKSDDGKEVNITYNGNNDVTGVTQKQDGTTLNSASITYDGQRRVSYATDSSGIKTSYTYLNGTSHLVTGVTTQNTAGTLITSESMTYTTDNNYVATYKDARGKVSTYTYNLQKGLMTSAEDPEHNTINYVYDLNTDALTSTKGNANPSMPVTTGFAYSDYKLNGITRSGTGYGYTYDNMNRVTAAKVGSNNLVTNTYDSRHRLATQTYANGAVYAPVYDSRDRFAGEKWNGTQTSAYFYNDNNQLSMAEDKITGISQQYNYDLSGRTSSVLGSDGSSLRIGYDAKSAHAKRMSKQSINKSQKM